jgi:hypothetical protein
MQMSNATVFLDSSKAIRHAVYLDSINQFEVFMINLLRDGRGQVFSMLKRYPEKTIQELSLQWVNTINFQNDIITQWNGKSIRVKYEQLCACPDEMMRQIFTFLNLDPDQGSLRYRDFKQHIMGNLGTRTAKTNLIEEKQEWRSRLISDHIKVFEQIGGSLNYSLGYK